VRDSYIVNPDFDGLRAAELADDSLTNWCHHVQYILPQVLAWLLNHVVYMICCRVGVHGSIPYKRLKMNLRMKRMRKKRSNLRSQNQRLARNC